MKQYFTRVNRWYYTKNKLEEAAIETIKKECEHRLVDEPNVANFLEDVKSKISTLNAAHKRATPLQCVQGKYQQKTVVIGRPNGDDLILLEFVEVKGVFPVEQHFDRIPQR